MSDEWPRSRQLLHQLKRAYGSLIDRLPGVTGTGSHRGVSYALGFLLVFAVVIAGTLALFMVGVETLERFDRDESLASNQENLAVIHSEIGDMSAQGAPRRVLDLELVDASVGFVPETALTLRLESDSGAFQPIAFETRVLRYHLQNRESTLYFAFGHGYRTSGHTDSAGISELPPLFDTAGSRTQLVVPILAEPGSEGPAHIGVSDTGERRIEAVRSNTSSLTRTHTRNNSVETMTGTLSISGVVHPEVWEDALEGRGFDAVQTQQTDGETTVSGDFSSTTLSIRTTTIDLYLGGVS